MPTERLFYSDPYLTEFDARVERVEDVGGRSVAILDRTAFYPTSGGQPFDIGTLGDSRVVEVVDREDGAIGHVVDRSVPDGAHVHGVIDWQRRFDHMQQHTGQHLLSAAFDRLLGVRTVSFHLGSDSSTIDLNRDVSAAEIAKAEADANRIVWEDRSVTIRFIDAAEASTIGLRKESARTGSLRIIDVADYDRSACGGTHVARTGAVGIIAVQSWERFKGGTRVAFVCGGRALKAFGALRDSVVESVRRLSVLPAGLPAAIERIQTESKDLKKLIKAQEERLAGYEAAELAARAIEVGSAKLVAEIQALDAVALKNLATAIAGRPSHIVILVSSSGPGLIVVARSKDIELDARDVLRQLIDRFGGKGGGTPEMAQGGGFNAAPEEMLSAALTAVTSGKGQVTSDE